VSNSTKEFGLKILKNVKVALKAVVLDFEEPETSKKR
jgi:hypothetical protein